MSTDLLDASPFQPRNQDAFVKQANALTEFHLTHCEEYRKLWTDWTPATASEELPWVHCGLFKHLLLSSASQGSKRARTALSSATSGISSKVVLDSQTTQKQAKSTTKILTDFIGPEKRPLLVLDSSKSLRRRGEVTARVSAAFSLQPFATQMHFVMADASDPESVRWDRVEEILAEHDSAIVYGFTSILWFAWALGNVPESLASKLNSVQFSFVHSGGWKKLEAEKVSREQFDSTLLTPVASGSRVVDFYGLVEQLGMIFPLCEAGYRHMPAWGDLIVRDSWTFEKLVDQPGQLQLINLLSHSAPTHSVLTEDIGREVSGPCPCGRHGKRFELLGRVPKSETRGCANV